MDETKRAAIQAANDVLEMVDTRGWQTLAAWVEGQIRLDADVIEKGARSWDEYQQAVGRIQSLRKVLHRPLEVTAKANTGETYE